MSPPSEVAVFSTAFTSRGAQVQTLSPPSPWLTGEGSEPHPRTGEDPATREQVRTLSAEPAAQRRGGSNPTPVRSCICGGPFVHLTPPPGGIAPCRRRLSRTYCICTGAELLEPSPVELWSLFFRRVLVASQSPRYYRCAQFDALCRKNSIRVLRRLQKASKM